MGESPGAIQERPLAMMTARGLLCLLCALLPLDGPAATTPLPPKPTRYVTDRAGVLGPARLDALNEKLAAFERTTSDQMLVYVDRSLPEGTTLEELGAAAIREWGVGQKGRSNGVIFFVFVNDRKMRLEVGYGLEGVLPDARARQITSDIVKPLFQRGDFASGIESGVAAVFAATRGEPFQGSGRTQAEGLWYRVSNSNWTFWVPILCLVPIGLLLFWALGNWVYYKVTGRPMPKPEGVYSSGSPTTYDSGGSSGGSLDSSSSDFSGGGGDGGGGGASDSW